MKPVDKTPEIPIFLSSREARCEHPLVRLIRVLVALSLAITVYKLLGSVVAHSVQLGSVACAKERVKSKHCESLPPEKLDEIELVEDFLVGFPAQKSMLNEFDAAAS